MMGDKLKIQIIAIIGKAKPKKPHNPVERFFFSACKAQTTGPTALSIINMILNISILFILRNDEV
jgi:hypothetical protein